MILTASKQLVAKSKAFGLALTVVYSVYAMPLLLLTPLNLAWPEIMSAA